MDAELRRKLAPSPSVPVWVIAALGMAAVWLCLGAIIGAIKVAADDESEVAADDRLTDLEARIQASTTTIAGGDGTTSPTVTVVDEEGNVVTVPASPDFDAGDGSTAPQAPGGDNNTGGDPNATPGGDPNQPSNPTATTAPPATTAPTPGDRTGVTDTDVKIGIHAPQSIGGAPLDLAADPVKGIEGYTAFINANGGIHGRRIILEIADDRYETSGGKDAARRLIESGNFIISGTLGVDQINVVANEANKAGVPYHAAGGSENDFAKLGLYQIGTSYDTHVIQLARFLSKDDKYKGKTVGITALDSSLIAGSVNNFKAEAARVGVNVVETVYVQKPTEQSSYSAEIQKLKDAGAQVVVPLQDPVSTSRMVQECVAALCGWTWTFSNFAHDGDTSLALFGGEWGRQGVRGLAAACYYLHPNADNPAHCGRMDKAHSQWVAVYGQEDWEENGQGGATGYQIVSMLAEALRRAGPDLTRERYHAAIQTYDRYDDLISSPITFAGRSHYAHGSDKMVVYEAGSDNTYKQLTPGFVEF